MVFEHQKCFGGYRVLIGSPQRSYGHPRQRYGPYGPREGTQQPTRGWCAPIEAGPMRKRKEERERKVWIRIPTSFPHPLFPPPSCIHEKGGVGQGRAPRGQRPTLGRPWLPLLPSHLYICGEGASRTDTTSIVSRVRHPPPQFTPRSYSRGA